MMGGEIGKIIHITIREAKSHIKSIRFFVIASLLILSVMGGTFGINSLVQSSYNSSKEYNIVCVQINANGGLNDALIIVYDVSGTLVDNARLYIDYFPYYDSQVSSGVFIVYDLNYGIHSVTVENTTAHLSILPQPYFNTTINAYAFDFDGDYYLDDFVVVITDSLGNLLQNITVYLDGKGMGSTGEFGEIVLKNLTDGEHTISIKYQQNEVLKKIEVKRAEGYDIYTILKNDPDNVLALTSGFVAFIVPISAIALAYDSIAREKMQNSLDTLLSKPIRRESIVLGKFLGTFLVVGIILVFVLGISVMIIDAASPKSPSLPVIISFIIGSLILLSTYIFMQILVSSLAKSTSSALLGGLGIWMVFQLFWGLIVLVVAMVMGIPLGSSDYLSLSNRIGLFNPSESYSLAISSSRGAVYGIPTYAPFVSMLLWLISMGLLSLLFFKKMVDSR